VCFGVCMVFNPDYVTKEAREAGINTKEGRTAKTITAPVSLWSLMELIRSKKGFNDFNQVLHFCVHKTGIDLGIES